jgi:tetratricopeptide (TPR) repeat protein
MRSIVYPMVIALSCIFQLAWAESTAANLSEDEIKHEWRKWFVEGDRLHSEGRFAEARSAMSKAVEFAERLATLDERLPAALHALGFLYQEHGSLVEAKTCYLRAVHLWEKLGPEQRVGRSKSIDNLIEIYMEDHNYTAAESLMRSRLQELEQGSTWQERATFFNMRAAFAFRQSHYGEAERDYQQSLTIWEEHQSEEDRNTAIVAMNLSTVYGTTKRYEAALKVGGRAVAILEKAEPAARPILVRALDSIGFLLLKLDRQREAERVYSRALDLAKEAFGPDHPISCKVMLDYSAVLRRLARKSEAKTLEGRARAILGQVKQTGGGTVDVFELNLIKR